MEIGKKLKTLKQILLFSLARQNKSFLLKLRPFPTTMTVAVTSRCNCQCIMCTYWKNSPADELSTEKIKSLLFQARKLGVQNVTFYGGEPLLRRDIFELIEFAKKSGLATSLITNGTLINKNLAKKLLATELDCIKISIDAVGEAHDKLRGFSGAYKKAVAAIDFLQQNKGLRKNQPHIQICSVIMKSTLNLGGIPQVLKLVEQKGTSFLPQLVDFSIPYFGKAEQKDELWINSESYMKLDELVNHLLDLKRSNPGMIAVSVPAIKYIKQYFRDPLSKKIPCVRGLIGEIWVNFNGDVHTCSVLSPLGNIKEKDLEEIITSDSWVRQTQQMFLKNCPGCACNYSANIESSISFLYNHLKEKIRAVF